MRVRRDNPVEHCVGRPEIEVIQMVDGFVERGRFGGDGARAKQRDQEPESQQSRALLGQLLLFSQKWSPDAHFSPPSLPLPSPGQPAEPIIDIHQHTNYYRPQ